MLVIIPLCIMSVFQEAGLREGDYIVAVNGADCRWAEHAEVIHTLKSCSERGLELDVITLHSHEVERRMSPSPAGEKECQSGSQRRAGREDERRSSSSLRNWSWRLGSTFSLSFGNFRESESMF